MKIILSRKGFDSDCGGYPSPILPDGRLISLPIPSSDSHVNSFHYSDLRLDELTTYYDLMQKLNIKPRLGRRVLVPDAECHLDPDIYKNIVVRRNLWKPLFGQIDAAQTHLHERIKEGDLFLFFGWFKKVIEKNGTYSFDQSNNGKHVIFGYLQIGEIMNVRPETNVPEWMTYHPHTFKSSRVKNNTIYVARNTLTGDDNLPGAGVFLFKENLVLTKKGLSRSKWRLPDFFRSTKISYHGCKSWKTDYFQSAARGQEFVVDENAQVEEWVRGLISNNI